MACAITKAERGGRAKWSSWEKKVKTEYKSSVKFQNSIRLLLPAEVFILSEIFKYIIKIV